MTFARRLRLVAAAAVAVPAALWFAAMPGRLAAAPADAPAWKDVVAEKDLEAIVKATTTELKAKTMKSAGTFNSGAKKAAMAGYALAAVGNVGAALGDGEAAKKAAALRDGALEFAAGAKAKKFADAKAGFAKIEKFPAIAAAEAAGAKPWKEVCNLDQTMTNVGYVNDAAVGAIKNEAEFKKAGKDLAAKLKLEAILARIAREEKPDADWQGWCDDMTKASNDYAAAIGSKSFKAAKDANDRLQKSCVKCHEKYNMGKD